MKKNIQTFSLCSFFVCTFIFAFIMFGQLRLPDEFIVSGNEKIEVGALYSCSGATESTEGEFDATIKLLNVIPVKSAKVNLSMRQYVVVGGDVFGIKLYTQGVMIVRTDLVVTGNGNVNPAKSAGIKAGDILLEIDGKKISRNSDVSDLIEKSSGKTMQFKIKRDGNEIDLNFTPELSQEDGKYRGGLWIRDSSAGIGTMTFYQRDTGVFAGLGHAVCDVDTGLVLPLEGGEAVNAQVMDCYKGVQGTPGELCGVFSGGSMGSLVINGNNGVYGYLDEYSSNEKVMPIATDNEVEAGAAQIISTIDDSGPQYFEVEISKVYSGRGDSKDMVITIKDSSLIAATGGIVQGMSGSPIIQNGMLVGAVTHVMVNDPLQGYGIFAQTMIETCENMQEKSNNQAS